MRKTNTQRDFRKKNRDTWLRSHLSASRDPLWHVLLSPRTSLDGNAPISVFGGVAVLLGLYRPRQLLPGLDRREETRFFGPDNKGPTQGDQRDPLLPPSVHG